MKQRIVNTTTDKNDIVNAMNSTSEFRKNWIKDKFPSITEILDTYPKFKDFPFFVSICKKLLKLIIKFFFQD